MTKVYKKIGKIKSIYQQPTFPLVSSGTHQDNNVDKANAFAKHFSTQNNYNKTLTPADGNNSSFKKFY